MSETQKSERWKGTSRLLKQCHWCTKRQEAEPFKACAQCKEVIYCSKECQTASWPSHKAGCKLSSEFKKALSGDAQKNNFVATFKQWHLSYTPTFTHAVICALDLGNNPSNVDKNVLYIKAKAKEDHKKLPANKKYELTGGCIFTKAEALEIIGPMGGVEAMESVKRNSEFMQKKGGLGVGVVLMNCEGFIYIVSVTLPAPNAVKIRQMADNWGDNWVERLRQVVN